MKLTDTEFFDIVEFVKSNFGINLSKKRILIEGRLEFTLKKLGYSNFADFIAHVKKFPNSEEATVFLNKITTNHTFFMREKQHFDFLTSTVLPDFERTLKDKEARIWSAACSYGHEPYNLAMCIDNYLGNKKSQWDTKILATDISENALQIAKNGIYDKNVVSELPESWQKKYFKALPNGQLQVTQALRKEVVFKMFNLMDNIITKKPFDLIVCRNVMIYFENDTKEALIERFYNALRPGGYLFIGHAETITKNVPFTQLQSAIYQK